MKKAYKIVFLGNTSVGKTTLISQYLYHKVQAPTPTIGIDFLSTTLEISGRQIRLQLWDTAGQERFRSIIGNYTRNTFIAIVVYSVDDPQSLNQVKAWISDYVFTHNRPEDVRIIMVANKTDLPSGTDFAEATAIADSINAKLVKTSAIDADGVKALSEAINEFIADDLENGDDYTEDRSERNALRATRRSRCC